MDMEIAVFLGKTLFYLSLCDTIFELNVKCNLNFTQTMKVFLVVFLLTSSVATVAICCLELKAVWISYR